MRHSLARGARRWRQRGTRAATTIIVVAAVACGGHNESFAARQVPGGNAINGRNYMNAAGCGTCHTIPGVENARGMVGPSLEHFAQRSFIAGELPNTAQNLERWIVDPPSVEPNTAMPKLGVTPTEARDIAAYLYKLR
jgi:cytochrome c